MGPSISTFGIKLENIQKGYAEVNLPSGRHGYVESKKFVKYTDFDKDEIETVYRWVAYIWKREGSSVGYLLCGKLTGYPTRKEAILAVHDFAKEEARRESQK